jgi:CheY-like chemotaxis protein
LVFARSGEEAIKIFSENKDINLVLMDVKMPGMDGYEASRKIREISSEIPIIAQTAFSTHGDAEKAREAGCVGYLKKPVDKIELFRLLSIYL